MPNVNLWNALEFIATDGSTLSAGSLDVPVVVVPQSAAQPYQNTVTLAQNAIGTLWDSANGPADFAYAYIVSDTGDAVNGWVVLELTIDENNIVKTGYQTLALAANVPLSLGSSAAYANYTAGFGGGTLSKIQKIKVKNLNTATANITVKLVY